MNRIANLFEREYALLTGRATTALYVLLKALGLEDAHVLVPINVCYAVPLAVLRSGNIPVFCDISLDHYGVTAETLAKALTPETRAAVIVHMYGHPGEWDEVADWCRRQNIYLIEDAALAIGGKLDNRNVGALGDSALLSFGYGKVIDCEVGGALLTNDERLYGEAMSAQAKLPLFSADLLAMIKEFSQLYRLMRQFEKTRPHIHQVYATLFDLYADSYFFQPDADWIERIWEELQKLPGKIEKRQERAAIYDQKLQHPWLIKTKFPPECMIWRYTFRFLNHRDQLLTYLRAHNIPASSWYPSVDRMFLERTASDNLLYPHGDRADDQVVNLWVDDPVSDEDVLRTTELIGEWLDDHARAASAEDL